MGINPMGDDPMQITVTEKPSIRRSRKRMDVINALARAGFELNWRACRWDFGQWRATVELGNDGKYYASLWRAA